MSEQQVNYSANAFDLECEKLKEMASGHFKALADDPDNLDLLRMALLWTCIMEDIHKAKNALPFPEAH